MVIWRKNSCPSSFVGCWSVLARILSPDDYGVISIVMVFITICNIFVTSSFGTAIVRQERASSVDFDTAFIFKPNDGLFALYCDLFCLPPIIADFYGMPVLRPVMRVFGIRIIISAVNNIQQAYIQRQMQFKKFFIATLFGTVISCVVGFFWPIVGLVCGVSCSVYD
jgi:O-antigen/teichoic acid export membrane protein